MLEDQFIIAYFGIGFLLWLVVSLYGKETDIYELLNFLLLAIAGWPLILVACAISYINDRRP
jgi:hypothetical protein